MKTAVSIRILPRAISAFTVVVSIVFFTTGCDFKPDLRAAGSVPSSLRVKGNAAVNNSPAIADSGLLAVNAKSVADAATIISRKQVPYFVIII